MKDEGGGVVITVDHETKESRAISIDELLAAMKARWTESEKQRLVAADELELEEFAEASKTKTNVAQKSEVAKISKAVAQSLKTKRLKTKRKLKRIVGQLSLRSRRVPLVEVSNSK